MLDLRAQILGLVVLTPVKQGVPVDTDDRVTVTGRLLTQCEQAAASRQLQADLDGPSQTGAAEGRRLGCRIPLSLGLMTRRLPECLETGSIHTWVGLGVHL